MLPYKIRGEWRVVEERVKKIGKIDMAGAKFWMRQNLRLALSSLRAGPVFSRRKIFGIGLVIIQTCTAVSVVFECAT